MARNLGCCAQCSTENSGGCAGCVAPANGGRPRRRGSHRGGCYNAPQAPYNPVGVFAAHLPSWQRKMKDIVAEEREFVNSQDGITSENAGDPKWLAGLIAGIILVSWLK